jgi:hypothetical protein
MARKSKGDVAEAPKRTPLGQARAAYEAGNVRLARKLAEAAAAGPEAERDEARRFLEATAPDRQALLTVAAVLVLIIVAAWLAILRHH